MQNRKQLADAGRRKLEEFRKAKAQGRAVAPETLSKHGQDPSVSPSASTHATSLPTPLTNGNEDSYLGTSAAFGQASQSRIAESGAQPNLVPTTVVSAPSLNPAPVTTFVVLQDAPIPFGATATGPATQGSVPRSSEAPQFSSNGGPGPPLKAPYAPAPAAAPWSGDTTKVSIPDLTSPSAASDTWARPSQGPAPAAASEHKGLLNTSQDREGYSAGYKAVKGREGSVVSGLSDDVSFFGIAVGDTELQPQAAKPSLLLTGVSKAPTVPAAPPSSSSFVDATDITRSFTAGGNSRQPALSSLVTNGSALPGVGLSAGAKGDASSCQTRSQAEAWLAADPKAHIDDVLSSHSCAGGAVTGIPSNAAGAELRSRADPHPEPPPVFGTDGWLPAVQPAASAAEEVAQAQAAAAPQRADSISGLGHDRAPESRQLEMRPSWLAYSAAMPPFVSSTSSASVEQVSANGTGSVGPLSSYGPLPGPVAQPGPSNSAASETSSISLTSGTSLWPSGTLKAAKDEAVTSVSALTPVPEANNIACYDQLSDSYLGSNGAVAATAVASDGRLSAAFQTPPQVLPEGPRGLDPAGCMTDSAVAEALGSASLALHASAPISAATSYSGGGGTVGCETSNLGPVAASPAAEVVLMQPPMQFEPSLASSSAASVPTPVQQQQQPRAAPAPSRFAWLFGNPARQPGPFEQAAAADAPTQPSAPAPAPLPSKTAHTDGGLPEVLSLETANQTPASPSSMQQSTSTHAFPQAAPVVECVSPLLPASHGDNEPSASALASNALSGFHTSAPYPALSSGLSASTIEPVLRSNPVASVETQGTADGQLESSRVAVDGIASGSAAGFSDLFLGQAPVSSGLPEPIWTAPLRAGAGAANGALLPWGDMAAGQGLAATGSAERNLGSAQVGSGGSSSSGVSGVTSGQDDSAPLLPSFLRATDAATRASRRDDRSVPATAASMAQEVSSYMPRETASTDAPDILSIPSFSTSFPPLSSGSLPPLPHPAAPRPPVAAPATAGTTFSMPHFSAAASYLSAYSSAAGPAPRGSPSVASTTTTASFLESYLDNLLSTMSSGTKDAGEDSHAHVQTAGRKAPSIETHLAVHDGAGQSNAGTLHLSNLADIPEEPGDVALRQHAGGVDDVPGGSSVLGDDTSDLAAGGELLGALEGAGSSGRGMLLPHTDNGVQLRSHHSRRASNDSAGMLSVNSHAAGLTHGGGASAHVSGSSNSGVSRAQFASLQQHIDELTEEKLALSRGLKQQTRINEQLAEENEELMRQYNARGAAMEELQRKMKQYEQELEAQALSLEGFSEERHAARSSYAEASSRAQALAAEVVGLEAQVLQLKSAVLKAERVAEEAQQRAKKLEKQVETLTREAQERAHELQQTQLKGRNLVVKLKQTEAKLESVEGKLAMQAALAGPHGSPFPNGHLLPPAPPPPPPKPTAEQEVQCDLAAELAAVALAAARSDLTDGSGAITLATDNGQDRTADAASNSSGAPQDGVGSSSLILARQPSAAISIVDDADTPERLVQVDWEAARPPRDAPSAVVAERTMAAMDSQVFHAAQGGALPEGVGAVALQLSRWLPAGPVSGGDPVAVMVEEELRLMESIHALLGSFEETQEATAAQIAELQGRVASLTSENDELRHKLELQTQRLELQMQGMTTVPPLSLHQTPVTCPSTIAEGSIGMTSGPHSYLPAQPFLPPTTDNEASVATPTRSSRVAPLLLMESAMTSAPSAKQTWMGYLFRPRQKKRTRSAIL